MPKTACPPLTMSFQQNHLRPVPSQKLITSYLSHVHSNFLDFRTGCSQCSDAHIYLDHETCSPFQRWQSAFVSSGI